MKAIVCTEYGPPDVLQLKEVDKPTPKDDGVLIKIRAAEITAGDCEVRRFQIALLFWLPLRVVIGIRKPRKNFIPGLYLAGKVEAVGRGVTRFRAGDEVFAATGFVFGACAEYVCLPSKYPMAIKPANMTYDEAASVPIGGLNTLHFMRKANIQRGDRVLVNGAAGSIGTFAIQLAKHFGAEVTGVDSTEKLDMLRSIGADHVIDYTREDFTESRGTYDVIFDVVDKSSFSGSLRSLRRNGRYLLGNPALRHMFRAVWTSMTSSKKVIVEFASETAEGLVSLRELIEAGKLRSVIDRRYPLEQTAEAHSYIESGQKKGCVVVTVESDDQA